MEKHSHYRWVILGFCFFLGMSIYITVLSVPPILHLITEDLSLNYADAGLLLSAPMILLCCVAILGGILADKIGTRRTAGIGVALIGLGGLLRGTANDFTKLLLFTCLSGVGWGLTAPTLPKIVGEWFPPEFVGSASGIYSIGMTVGSALALSLSFSWIYPFTGCWQGVFYIWGAIALTIDALWWIVAQDVKVAKPMSNHLNSKTQEIEKKLFNIVWKNKNIWIVATIFLMGNTLFYVETGWLPLFFQIKEATPEIASLMVAVLTIAGIPATLIMPVFSDRVGLRKPFLAIPSFASAAAAILSLATPLSFDWVVSAILGLSASALFIMPLVIAIDLVESSHVGRVSGMIVSIGYIGSIAGPLLAGYLIETTGFFFYIPVILTVVSAGSLILSIVLLETGGRKRDT